MLIMVVSEDFKTGMLDNGPHVIAFRRHKTGMLNLRPDLIILDRGVPDNLRQVARERGVPVIDLDKMEAICQTCSAVTNSIQPTADQSWPRMKS